ncbi:MAG: DUF4288 domain-containing protein, partial [Pedobacter sp.]
EKLALAKAHKIIQEEKNILASRNQTAIRWDFINMTELYKLDELKDGSEIYYNILEVNDADQYIEMSHQKALLIGQNLQAGVTATV